LHSSDVFRGRTVIAQSSMPDTCASEPVQAHDPRLEVLWLEGLTAWATGTRLGVKAAFQVVSNAA
jgi:hypothetical protein